jgi:transposase-like protein
MGQKRRNFSSSFKSKVVLEALKEREPLSQLASRYGIHANQITKWKKQASENFDILFDKNSGAGNGKAGEQALNKLYEKIGKLEVERDWLKKKS